MATCGALALLDATSGHFTVLNAICGNAQGQWYAKLWGQKLSLPDYCGVDFLCDLCRLHEALQTTRRYFRLLRLNKASMLRQYVAIHTICYGACVDSTLLE